MQKLQNNKAHTLQLQWQAMPLMRAQAHARVGKQDKIPLAALRTQALRIHSSK